MAKVTRTSDDSRPRAASKLKSLRLERGLTQEQAAALVGVDARRVRKWENGEAAIDAVEYLLELEARAAKRAA